MGIEHTVHRLLGDKVSGMKEIAREQWQASQESYKDNERVFLKELRNVLKPEIYSKELLAQTAIQNASYGKAFINLAVDERDKVFEELDILCVKRMKIMAHQAKFNPHVSVFVFARNTQVCYIDGLRTNVGDSEAHVRGREDVRWLIECLKKGLEKVVIIESSDELESYLAEHDNQFPDWLKDMSFIQEPQYYPVI